MQPVITEFLFFRSFADQWNNFINTYFCSLFSKTIQSGWRSLKGIGQLKLFSFPAPCTLYLLSLQYNVFYDHR